MSIILYVLDLHRGVHGDVAWARISDEFANLVTMLLVRICKRSEAHLFDGVQRVLGREPRTFANYLADSSFA